MIATSAQDRRTFKDLPVNETIECPVDPEKLPPDAVRVENETVIVQDIKIKPHNLQSVRHVYYQHQTSVPIVCDDAGQFKLLTEKLALCCPVPGKADAGRHYEKLSPVVPCHVERLEEFLD